MITRFLYGSNFGCFFYTTLFLGSLVGLCISPIGIFFGFLVVFMFWIVFIHVVGEINWFIALINPQITYQRIVSEHLPPPRQRHAGVHGDAGWATETEIDAAKVLFSQGQAVNSHHRNGVYLGSYTDPYATPPPDLDKYFGKDYPTISFAYHGENNILTIAPPGSGKGTGAIIPTLLLNQESTFVLDIKGENYFITAPARSRMGHTIMMLNPFDIWGEELGMTHPMTHHFNPLQFLSPKQPDFIRRINRYANSMTVIEGHDPYWPKRGRQLVACLMGNLCSDPEELAAGNNNLGRLIDILSLPFIEGEGGFTEYMKKLTHSRVPFVRNTAGFFAKATKQVDIVRDAAETQLNFLNEPAIRDFLSYSDFDFLDLRQQPVTVYCMLPHDAIESYPGFTRLMVECFFSRLSSRLPRRHERRVLTILDEQAQLKHMDILADAPAMLRGYNVRIWSIYQNIGQIREHYKNWENFISTAGVVQIMNPNDEETADYFSRRAGSETVTDTTTSTSTSRGWNTSSSFGPNGNTSSGGTSGSETRNTNHANVKVPFLTPQDFYNMPNNRSILFLKGKKYPVLARRTHYLEQLGHGPDGTFFGTPYAPHPAYDTGAFDWFRSFFAKQAASPPPPPSRSREKQPDMLSASDRPPFNPPLRF